MVNANLSSLKVAKFGGTSMADATAMKRSARVARDHGASVIVVSATSGTTNQLLQLAELGQTEPEEMMKIREQMVDRHRALARELECRDEAMDELEALFQELWTLTEGIHLLKDCHPRIHDNLLGMGERMSSLIFSECLNHLLDGENQVECFDVRRVIKTDSKHGKANPQFDAIEKEVEAIKTSLNEGRTIVAQGFIGSDLKGKTTTLGRGGSDYSAAILAWALDAEALQIWTDVAGIATTDPRIAPKAKPIERMSFAEAAELATFGAKVLHPTTIAPARWKKIPVFVGSSYEPDERGTWICAFEKEDDKKAPLVRALTNRKKQSVLTISTPKMLQTYGFLSHVFQVFNRHQVSVDAITTSEISVALTVDDDIIDNTELIDELKDIADVEIEPKSEMVSLIGNDINYTAGLAHNIFKALGDINVRMICLGASRHNFCFLVKEGAGDEAIRRLHHFFLEREEE